MARISLLLVIALAITSCFAQFQTQGVKAICLYNAPTGKVLKPLQLKDTDCPNNKSYCMNDVYKYTAASFKYNGVASLMPKLGEVVMFLSQDARGNLDFVSLVNANIQVVSKVWVQITGADPVDIILRDDPTDAWTWNMDSNTGNFTWTTQPGFTDGVIIGHINFIDNYCMRSSFNQVSGAITNMSIMSGSVSAPTRVLSQKYVPGQIFEFCQYPVTAQISKNATCPTSNDGSASISIVFGPSNVGYTWYNSAGVKIASTANVTGLSAGTYSIFVNDTNNVSGCDAERTVTIYDHSLYGAFVTTTKFSCTTKGSASASPNGGSSGFTYQWFKADGTSVGSGASITGLNNGDYYVRVSDNCGSVAFTNFTIATTGCCGDGICQANETCTSANPCVADCGKCCPAGTYVSGSDCIVCPPGSFSNTIQAPQCTKCPVNTYNAGGSDACTACPANYFSAVGSGKCTRCTAGSVRATGESTCHTCDAGSFAAPCDSSQCAPCPAGTFSSADGAYQCTTCAPGSFSSAGSTACNTCPPNTFSAAGASACTSCPQGTFSSVGATHLLACN